MLQVRVQVLVDEDLSSALGDKSTKDLEVRFSDTRKARKTGKGRIIPPRAAKPERDPRPLGNV